MKHLKHTSEIPKTLETRHRRQPWLNWWGTLVASKQRSGAVCPDERERRSLAAQRATRVPTFTDKLGSKDSSRHLQINCAISYFLSIFNAPYVPTYTMWRRILKTFCTLERVNKALDTHAHRSWAQEGQPHLIPVRAVWAQEGRPR
jgi:hypothetical protein